MHQLRGELEDASQYTTYHQEIPQYLTSLNIHKWRQCCSDLESCISFSVPALRSVRDRPNPLAIWHIHLVHLVVFLYQDRCLISCSL